MVVVGVLVAAAGVLGGAVGVVVRGPGVVVDAGAGDCCWVGLAGEVRGALDDDGCCEVVGGDFRLCVLAVGGVVKSAGLVAAGVLLRVVVTVDWRGVGGFGRCWVLALGLRTNGD